MDRRIQRRCFRPLFWWLGISCLLVLWDLHLRNAARTTLYYRVLIEGQPVQLFSQVNATVNGHPVESGRVIPIGLGQIEISAPDTEAFQTNFFVWYGAHDLGTINLPWRRGQLDLTLNPEASLVTLNGPHQRLSLTNSSGANLNLPVGQYDLSARIGPFREERTIRILRDQTVSEELVLELGKVALTSEPATARFQLTSINQANRKFTGETPAFLEYIPAGRYQLETWIGDYRKSSIYVISKDITNRIDTVFEYGALTLTSDPEGATVRAENRRTLGETPLTLTGQQPGTWTYQLQRSGYEATNVTLTLRANETTEGHAKLLDRRYRPALDRARQLFESDPPDFERALQSVNLALEALPDDPVATELKRDIEFTSKLAEAKRSAQEHRARNAHDSIEFALERRPDDEEAQALRELILAHYDEWERERNTEFAFDQFETASRRIAGSEFFGLHQWRFEGEASDIREAISRALPECEPVWETEPWEVISYSTRIIQGTNRELLKPNKHCLILASEISPGEVLVLARFWDFVVGITKIVETRDGNPIYPATIPVHPDYYKTSRPEEAEARRKAIAESFINALKHQLEP